MKDEVDEEKKKRKEKKTTRTQDKHLQSRLNEAGGDAADVAPTGQGRQERKNVAFIKRRSHGV